MQCVYLATQNPPKQGGLSIFNQRTERFSINQLAQKVKQVGEKLGYKVRVEHLENPRKEAEDHYYNPKYTSLIELGLKPHFLTDEVLSDMFRVVEKYKDRINKDAIYRGVRG